MALSVSQVDQAIEDILTKGQAVTIDGHTWTAADLDKLRILRRELKSEAADDMLSRAAFGRPRR